MKSSNPKKVHQVDNQKGVIPLFIASNLRQSFRIRPYQLDAFEKFDGAWTGESNRHLITNSNNPLKNGKSGLNHFLFQMATGSGKTLIMAGLILYLYEKGYRNFLFFVNSTSIIDKTKDNFLNWNSSKYLFADRIVINEKVVKIKSVESFQDQSEEDINIIFSTIQGLHSNLNIPRENSVTFADFESTKTVLISDESHHINAETKRRSQLKGDEKNNILTWENTVEKILQSHTDNVLLEFTATIDFSIPTIAEKYKDKLIYDYPLRQFRRDGYSKEVVVIQTDLPLFERALVALLMSQYRKQSFLLHGLNIKPVILFKSETIKDSLAFYTIFVDGLIKLNTKNLNDALSTMDERVQDKLRKLFGQSEDDLEILIQDLQRDFQTSNLLIINSKEESEKKQLMVNSLEEASNPYRAVFAVDKLNEGWDVLNLFDIVRLHEDVKSNPSKNKKTTISEAQLIGRGARYCPFQLKQNDLIDQRKYDDMEDHPLKICEQLYYHSSYNPSYIEELDIALEEIGIKNRKGEVINDEKSNFIVTEKVLIDNTSEVFSFVKLVQTLDLTVNIDKENKLTYLINFAKNNKTDQIDKQRLNVCVIDRHIIRKAINTLPFYEFSNLKIFIPALRSIEEFITSAEYLRGIEVNIIANLQGKSQITHALQLEIVIYALTRIEELIRKKVKN